MEPKDIAGYMTDQQDQMLEFVVNLAEINSGSFNIPGLNEVAKILKKDFAELNCESTLMPVAPMQIINRNGEPEDFPLGPVFRCWKRPEAPTQVLLVAHMDTVYPKEHVFQKTQRKDDILHGPGVADIKGGIAVMLWGLKAFEQLPQAHNLGWEVVISSDEEVGSLGSTEIIQNCAKKHAVGFVFEPSVTPEGALASSRKGSSKYTLVMRGKSAHAGREFDKGRNAICKMADIIGKINALNGQREGVTINVAVVQGGDAVNVVPDCCICRLDVRVPTSNDADWVDNCLNKIEQEINKTADYKLEVHRKVSRKPKEIDAETSRLYELVKKIGAEQDLQITWQPSGGVCDGNTLSAMGLPNVDTLGVRGGKIHSIEEYLIIPSLVERAQLLTNLLINLSENGFK